jgi:hypothetical protein
MGGRSKKQRPKRADFHHHAAGYVTPAAGEKHELTEKGWQLVEETTAAISKMVGRQVQHAEVLPALNYMASKFGDTWDIEKPEVAAAFVEYFQTHAPPQ